MSASDRFQGLDEGFIAFSKAWKSPAVFFQALENGACT